MIKRYWTRARILFRPTMAMMIRPRTCPAALATSATGGKIRTPLDDATPNIYGPDFWLCYVANAMLMIAVSLMFRYADFVTYLGGSERELGMIVGVGMSGALAARVLLGIGMDRFGPRRIWLLALGIFILATLAHLLITSVHGPAVYLVRILLTIGISGGVGASLTYVSLRVPETRIAEMVGTIGTSGFLGLAIGPVLGDWLFGAGPVSQLQLDRMFALAALAGLVSLAAAVTATRGQVRRPHRRPYPAWIPLVRRYHPGLLLLVALAMGLGTGLPGVFVRAFAAELGLPGITSYFLVYSAVAFAARIVTRRWPEILGIRRVLLIGLAALAVSMLLYLTVTVSWQLAIPATVAGLGHALLFPAIVAGGALSFPSRYRGLATTLVLGMLDVGNLLGQPAVGFILHYADQGGLPKYPTMFILVAVFLASVATLFGWQTRHDKRDRTWKQRPRRTTSRPSDGARQELAE
ncbi:MAG: MFS transporter [Pirellulaceae bacterium]